MIAEVRDASGRDATATRLELQEANEKLVLAALQAHELAEQAERARGIAESAVAVADEARSAAESATERVEAALVRSEQTARALEHNERELRATGQMREEMIGIVGHDLRNPLAAIQILAGLLARKGTLAHEHVELVRRISRSAERMKRLIAQLVEFTRARLGGGVALEPRPADLGQICRDVVEELEASAPGRLRCELAGDLTGRWDHDRLVDAISNIAGNAIEYATPGTPILVRAWGETGAVRLEITNQGDPLPPEVLPHLFEPFRRGRPQAGSQAGHLGLGLYIAHQIVVSHDGTLTAWSADGITTFAVRLPQQIPAPPTAAE